MSTQAEINKKRNEYMETLNLQASINDMNLQANKTYLLTGQLPPQSQMQDTRTTAEKMKDIEMLKHKTAEILRPIAEPSFAYAIIQKLLDNPLNIDNSLFRFFSQRANSIVEQLKGLYPYGISGDANDVEVIVNYIRNMYSSQQGAFQSTKSYMNSLSTGTAKSNLISSNDMDKLHSQFDDLLKDMTIIFHRTPRPELRVSMGKILELQALVTKIKQILPSTREIQGLMSDISKEVPPDLPDHIQYVDDPKTISEVFKLLEKLPKYETINTMLTRAKKYVSTGNFNLLREIVQRILDEFKSSGLTHQMMNDNAHFRRYSELLQFQRARNNHQDLLQETQTIETIKQQQQQRERYDKATKVYVVNPEDDPVNATMPGLRAPRSFYANPSNIPPNSNITEITETNSEPDDNVYEDYEGIDGAFNAWNDFLGNPLTPVNPFSSDTTQDVYTGYDGIRNAWNDFFGNGIQKKVRQKPGRKSSFVGFGISEINKKSLENDIITLRRGYRKGIYVDLPSKKVSKKLSGIVKTIMGGGVPSFNDLNSLDEDEKEYLHKLVSKAELSDRLSVPAPSKDSQEKLIHQFEVMKGQIMSGNDSIELVRKFKLLIRKLSNMKLLPKAEVNELLETLIDIGY